MAEGGTETYSIEIAPLSETAVGRGPRSRGCPGGRDEFLSPARTSASPAGRPRSEAAHQAILDATLGLLSEVGFSALTVESIAARAGVGKATIYRRWPSKLPLVVEAFGGLPGLEDVDTGSLRTDLATMLRSYLQHFNATPLAAVLPSLAGERAHNSELQVFDTLLRDRRQPLRAAFERAVARGELSPDLDLQLAADLVVGPIAVRLYFTGARIHPRIVGPMIDMALGGILKEPS